MTGARNVRAGIVLLCGGLLLGLAASLYAFVPLLPRVPVALDQYDDLVRRLLRLAHVAAVMLPLINIVLGGCLDRLALAPRTREAVSWMLLAGAFGLPLALVVEAVLPPARALHLAGVPAVSFCAGVLVCAVAAARHPLVPARSAPTR